MLPGTAPDAACPDLEEAALATLHQQRSKDDLFHELERRLGHLLPGHSVVLQIPSERAGLDRVALALGPAAPEAGSLVRSAAGDGITLPLCYRGKRIGQLAVREPLAVEPRQALERLLTHTAIAFANLELNEHAYDSANAYCASLQILEEGIGLFQETDAETISARFLSLAGSVLGSHFGAILLAERIGTGDSSLRLDQALGIPEQFLRDLRMPDGRWWPETLPRTGVARLQRAGDGSLGGLPGERVPAAVHDVVVCPLAYHGISAGICLVFNAGEPAALEARLESVRRLGELGGAMFHRLALERAALRNQQLETQLEIASEVQRHLMPFEAPRHRTLDFAYCCRPAQQVGGDYVDLVVGEDDRVYAIVADVSGHGINSALLMTSLRSSYRADVGHRTPDGLFSWLNRNICQEVAETGMFLTAASFVLPAEPGPATFVGAGHTPVLVWRQRTRCVETLLSPGIPLGLRKDAEFPVLDVTLDVGDVILLHTDGVTECVSPDGHEMFGEGRLEAALRANVDESALGIQQAVLRALESFNPTGTWSDDVSLCVIKVRE